MEWVGLGMHDKVVSFKGTFCLNGVIDRKNSIIFHYFEGNIDNIKMIPNKF